MTRSSKYTSIYLFNLNRHHTTPSGRPSNDDVNGLFSYTTSPAGDSIYTMLILKLTYHLHLLIVHDNKLHLTEILDAINTTDKQDGR